MIQLIQVGGALAILAAYFALQYRRLGADRMSYLLLNLVGAAALAVAAAVERQWGFLLLEVVWAAVTLPPLVRLVAAR